MERLGRRPGKRDEAAASHTAALALAAEIDEPEERDRATASLARLREAAQDGR